MENWNWIELIGFDKDKPDCLVGDFLKKAHGQVYGITLLLYDMEFVLAHSSLQTEVELPEDVCSYAGHPYNEDRAIQKWTNFDLKRLINCFHAHDVKVLLSFFNNFSYINQEKQEIRGAWSEKHPEVREFSSFYGYACDCNNVLKRMNDGSSFGDFIAKKVKEVVDYYGFDGLHIADGISSHRLTMQTGDYSDDMVERFLENTKIDLPQEIQGKCDGNFEKSFERYKYIFHNLRLEYTSFVSEEYAKFYRKIEKALPEKTVIFNNAWTRSPFEAMFRYAIDYKKVAYDSMHAVVIEDMGSSMPLFSEMERGGFDVPFEERLYCNYEFMLTQMSIKSYVPQLSQINLTPLKDNQEQWNLIDNAPNEFRKGIVRRNWSFILQDGKIVPCSEGPLYCTADGLTQEKWDMICATEEIAARGEIEKIDGLAYVWNDDLKAELAEYIKTRNVTSDKIRQEFAAYGVAPSCMSDFESIKTMQMPFVLFCIENYKNEQLKYLENYKKSPLIVFGYKKVLLREPDAEFTVKDSGFSCYIYNTGAKLKKEINQKTSFVDASPEDGHGGIWTMRLKYNLPSKMFYKAIASYIRENIPMIRVKNRNGCRAFAFLMKNGKYRVVIYNDSYFFELPVIQMPFAIKTARALFKPEWFVLPVKNNTFKARVCNRGVEIVEVEAEEKV